MQCATASDALLLEGDKHSMKPTIALMHRNAWRKRMQLIKSKLVVVVCGRRLYVTHFLLIEAAGVFLQFNKNLGHFVFFL